MPDREHFDPVLEIFFGGSFLSDPKSDPGAEDFHPTFLSSTPSQQYEYYTDYYWPAGPPPPGEMTPQFGPNVERFSTNVVIRKPLNHQAVVRDAGRGGRHRTIEMGQASAVDEIGPENAGGTVDQGSMA